MKIDIKGAIVSNDEKWIYDWFEMDSVSPKDVLNQIEKANGEPLEIYINSPGGDIGAGAEIYAALQEYSGVVNIHVVGYACSSASVIACAGTSDMVRTGLFMYHNVSGGAKGDYHSMDKASEVLKVANRAIASAYTAKTGKSEEELLALMDAETWMTAEEAVEHGFIDKIAESKNLKLTASNGSSMLPQSVIDRIRNTVKPPLNEADIFMRKKAQAQLELLKIGGIKE